MIRREDAFMVYYVLALVFKWPPSVVDGLGLGFIVWLLERLKADRDVLAGAVLGGLDGGVQV